MDWNLVISSFFRLLQAPGGYGSLFHATFANYFKVKPSTIRNDVQPLPFGKTKNVSKADVQSLYLSKEMQVAKSLLNDSVSFFIH